MLNKLLSVSEEEEPTTDKRTEKVRGRGRPRKIVEENVESTPKNKGPSWLYRINDYFYDFKN